MTLLRRAITVPLVTALMIGVLVVSGPCCSLSGAWRG